MLDFLPEFVCVLIPGERVFISGTANNRLIQLKRVIPDIINDLNLRVIEQDIPLLSEFDDFQFFLTDGFSIENWFMRETIIERVE